MRVKATIEAVYNNDDCLSAEDTNYFRTTKVYWDGCKNRFGLSIDAEVKDKDGNVVEQNQFVFTPETAEETERWIEMLMNVQHCYGAFHVLGLGDTDKKYYEIVTLKDYKYMKY